MFHFAILLSFWFSVLAADPTSVIQVRIDSLAFKNPVLETIPFLEEWKSPITIKETEFLQIRVPSLHVHTAMLCISSNGRRECQIAQPDSRHVGFLLAKLYGGHYASNKYALELVLLYKNDKAPARYLFATVPISNNRLDTLLSNLPFKHILPLEINDKLQEDLSKNKSSFSQKFNFKLPDLLPNPVEIEAAMKEKSPPKPSYFWLPIFTALSLGWTITCFRWIHSSKQLAK